MHGQTRSANAGWRLGLWRRALLVSHLIARPYLIVGTVEAADQVPDKG